MAVVVNPGLDRSGTAQCLFKYEYYFIDKNMSWVEALAYCRNNLADLVILVNELMTWDEALNHCQTFYTDLVSLSTKSDFNAVNSVLGNQNTRVWTGLYFMNGIWFWTNNQPLGKLVNPSSCPAFPFRCGALVPGTEEVENRDCMEKMNFACYKKKIHHSHSHSQTGMDCNANRHLNRGECKLEYTCPDLKGSDALDLH
ncbi:hypothetical protein QTP70_000733 [Hemibagrus guttatus]|uniref:C-type lectin domain-containing protein n=1 Tax=Hemibagrus guttatus TaxID=175788 RepID=A0AAE0RIY7_9TELE|nr:hypothetical protein QTP70_000733 [Hemibagrus guttatus]